MRVARRAGNQVASNELPEREPKISSHSSNEMRYRRKLDSDFMAGLSKNITLLCG
jgi:hypothetical protein